MTTAAAARLRLAANCLRANQLVPEDIALDLADAFEAAVDDGVDLDEALGLAVDPVVRRSELVLGLARHFEGSPTGRAKAIAVMAGRYAASGWLRDRQCEALAEQRSGTPDEIFHALHRLAESTGIAWPLGWRSIYASLQSEGLDFANCSNSKVG